MGDGRRRWFVRDGRLRALWRALWRALLFVIVFMAIVQLEVLLFPALATPPTEARLSAGLVAQGVMLLTAAVLAGWAMLRWVDGRPPGDLGFDLAPRVPREVAAGLAIGAGAVAVSVLTLAVVGVYRYVPEGGSPGGWLAVSAISLAALALPAAAEEAVFRGYLFRTLVEGAGAAVAIGVTSLLFAVVHGWNPNVSTIGLVNIFLAGVLLGVAVLRTGALWLATAVHLGWNWVMAGPLDLPVSGLGGYDVPLYDVARTGPAWLTGGAFGPEGGLVSTVAAALALVAVVRITRPRAALAGSYETGRSGRTGRREDVRDG